MRLITKLQIIILSGMMVITSPLYVLAVSPVASDVTITSGPYAVTETVEGEYSFSDGDGNPEDESTLRFLRSANSDGSDSTVISPVYFTDDAPFELDILEPWRGDYIAFSVTPRDGAAEVGDVVYSSWERVNLVPDADDDNISGVNEGSPYNLMAPGVLINDDSGGDFQAITAQILEGPYFASAFTLHSDGEVDYTHDGSENHVDSFYYHVNDGIESSSIPAKVRITITPTNDVPELSDIEPGALQYEEGDAPVIITSTIQVAEGDNDTIQSATVRIIDGFDADEDRLTYTSSTLTVIHDNPNGTLTISGAAITSEYETALQHVRYNNINDTDPSTTNRVIRFQVNDGISNSNTVQRTIQIDAVNDPPDALEDSYTGIPEGGSVTTTIGADDHILSNDDDVDGPLALTAHLVDDVEHGYLTLSSNGTFTYEHDSSEFLTDAFTYAAFDGEDRSDTVEVSFNMVQVNDPPVVDNLETDTVHYTEDDPSRLVTTACTVEDDDDLDIESATIEIVQGFVSGEDSLVFPDVSGLTIEYDTLSGVLTATGTAPLLTYQDDLLHNIRYWNTNTLNPSTAFRHIQITLNDGDDDSEPVIRVIEVEAANDPPEADNTELLGTDFYVKEIITADYDFSDPDGDDEGDTEFRWYTSEDVLGTNRTPLRDWVTVDTFTIRFQEGGLYLQAIVRPRDENGAYGLRDTSDYHYVNAAPVLEDFAVVNEEHPGGFAVGETVRADYTFNDLEDEEGIHSFQWYRSNEGSWETADDISGAILDSFQIRPQDANRYIALEAIPEALTGSTPGAVHRSIWHLIGETPTANISGSTGTDIDSICIGDTDTLIVTLGGSNAPWSFSYTIDGLDTMTISDIPDDEPVYELVVTEAGFYELSNVSDKKYDFGNTTGEVTLAYYNQPTALMAESELAICDNDDANYGIAVELSGVAPWQVSYQYSEDADSSTLVSIDTAYVEIQVTIEEAGTYSLLHVWDAHCMDVGSGSTEVITKENPKATLIGDTVAVCPGEDATLEFELEGNGPWAIYYTHNDGDPIWDTINQNSGSYTYELEVSDPGTYEIIRVVNEEDDGCAYGTTVVKTHKLPTATISGTDTICDGGVAEFEVELGGTAPWNLFYRHGTDVAVEVTGIMESPYILEATENGTYSIYEVDDINHCGGGEAGTATLHVNPLPVVDLFINQTIFTKDSENEPIDFSPEGGDFSSSSYAGSIFLDFDDDTWKFDPRNAWDRYCSPRETSEFLIRYTYEDAVTSCSNTTTDTVYILEYGASIEFSDTIFRNRELFCFNDDTIKLKGINQWQLNNGVFTITGNEGLQNMGDNRANIYPSQISTPGQKTITYIVPGINEDDPPQSSRIIDFEVIDGDFVWDNECFDTEALVHFYDTSEASKELVESRWNFYVGDDTIAAEGFETVFTFNKRDNYQVEHIITSQFNDDRCSDIIRKELVLKPTFNVSSVPYDESFDYSANFWTSHSETEGANNSWNRGITGGAKFNLPPTENAWYTETSSSTLGENSFVISPCFDFRNSFRPMIKFDLWKELQVIEGAVLQYTLDNGYTWHTIGAPDDGIEWYNSFTITSLPGGQTLGWTDTDDDNWVEARHKLDELVGETKVRFRMAYGADDGISIVREGLAFDDIWIGERNKKVLFEYFTNTTEASVVSTNEEVNTLVNKGIHANDIIDLHYFVNSADPFNALNPAVHNSRGYYYDGIAEYPYGIMDGGRNNHAQYLFDFANGEDLTDNDLTLAVLYDNEFEINLQTTKGGGDLYIEVELTALQSIPASNLTLHVVIVEEVVDFTGASGQTQYESVVKEMIPDAIGTGIYQSFTVGASEEFEFNYTYEDVYDENQIRVVAYLQDETTKEVLQAEKINPNIADGIDEQDMQGTGMTIYPNPVRDIAYINTTASSQYKRIVEIYNIEGTVVGNYEIEAGLSRYELNLSLYSAGIYFVKLREENRIIGSQKLVILGQD